MLILDTMLRPTGHFAMNVYRRGRLIERVDEPNLVVGGYGSIQAHLLGGTVANNSITQFGVGTGGATPATGNTGLTAAYLNSITAVSYPANNQVAFGFALGSGEANGMAILEFGLFTAAGALYARKIRAAALNKDTDLAFSGTWTITFP